jgi:class 3 adenylate cyclase
MQWSLVGFAIVLLGGLGYLGWELRSGTGPRAPGLAPAGDVSGNATAASLDELRALARGETACSGAVPLWRAVIERAGDDLEAYRSLYACGGGGDIDLIVSDTTRMFEESRVLSVVPALLDALDVKQLVPILNGVQQREGNDAAGLRLIGKLRRDMGDLNGAVSAFREALVLDPDSVEGNLELGYALVDGGEIDEARGVFRSALAREDNGARMTRLYALAVGWPLPFIAVVFGLVGVFGSVGAHLPLPSGRTIDPMSRWAILGSTLTTVFAVGWYFEATADRMAFGTLLLLVAAAVSWAVALPLRLPVGRALGYVGARVGDVAAGRIYRRIAGLPRPIQMGVLVVTAIALLVVPPLIRGMDLRIAVLFLLVMLLFSTVGSILLDVLQESQSLRVSLRWLGVVGTFPFLMFFLNFERDELTRSLWGGRGMSPDAQNRLAAYFVIWGLGVALAWLLSRILARSILDPLGRITRVLDRVQGGDFSARVGIDRRDEIGALGGAVDEMAEGLSQREALKQTFRRHMNPEVAELLMRGDPSVTRGRLVHATVLFTDVRGFTSLSESMDPVRVVEVLNEYFARMEPVIRRWGGVVDKFLGDGMLVVWDIPAPKADGPLAGVPSERLAVQAGLDMLAALEAFNEELGLRGMRPLEIGIGVNAGELIAGPVGSPDRLEYTVIGDTVNTAQRVEGQARREVLITEAVARRVEDAFELEARDPVLLKGKAHPIVLYRVGRAKGGAATQGEEAGWT